MGKAAPWGFGKMWLVRVWGAGQWEERDAGSWPLQAIYYHASFPYHDILYAAYNFSCFQS